MAKTDTRDANRRVEFTAAGAGVYLKLTNAGIRTLHNTYGKDHVRIVNEAFMSADVGVMEALLALTPHKGDEPIAVGFDDLDHISLQDLTDKLRDAWSLSIHGRTFEDQVSHIQSILAEAEKAEADPLLTSPAAGSDISNELLSGPISDQPNSTA